jgi:uncharacterized iron-regulated protein
MPATMRTLSLLCLLCLTSVACRAVTGARWSAVDTATGETVDLETMADALVDMDVVFLGEEHDNSVGHELQLALTQLLLERRGSLVISLEMFERDAQNLLDLYLAGAIDEAYLLEHGRPWPNYAEHYRPLVELAKAEGLPVLAANCYRPLASRVGKQGRWSVVGEPWAAARVDAGPGAYRDKFVGLMGEHAADMGKGLDKFFAAQCLKDETMAESIARVLAEEPRPLVVHLNGYFHSDGGLGTVERLLHRVPDARVGLVTMISGVPVHREVTEDERERADYVWRVPSED